MHDIPFKINFDKKKSNKAIKKFYFSDFDIRDKDKPLSYQYLIDSSIDFYKNYLEWFYQTFNITEEELRKTLFSELKIQNNYSILITGIGLGHELDYLLKNLTDSFEGITIYAQDYSEVFIDHVFNKLNSNIKLLEYLERNRHQVILFNSDASNLPIKDSVIDYAHHFGGINNFCNIQDAISEMSRVTKMHGRIMFSDESVAPWLRKHELGKMVIHNNSFYGSKDPINLLPFEASEVKLEWIVRNCFYKISFGKNFKKTSINPEIEHKSPRGGSMRKRYFGKIDGIDEELREKLIKFAKTKGISQNKIIEDALNSFLK